MKKLLDDVRKSAAATAVIALGVTATLGITVAIAMVSHYQGLYEVKVNAIGIHLTLDGRQLEAEPE